MTQELAGAQAAPPQKEQMIIKGSWEDLLQQAQQLASNQNDEAIPRYEKIVQRLGKLADAQRRANGGRLQDIFLHAALQLQAYLTLRERYDEALAALEQAQAVADDDERDPIAHQQILVLFMAGRLDEAFAQLRARTAAIDADISDWGALVVNYLRYDRVDEASRALQEAEAWVAQQIQAAELDDESVNEFQAYLTDLRTDLALKQGAWDEAEALYAKAAEQNALYQQNAHMFYIRLIQNGEYARALPYIARDQQHPIRAGFWHGVAEYRLGHKAEAAEQWQRVSQIDPAQSDEPSFSEFMLTHYYLGDKERQGLGTVLQVIQESRRYDWQTLFLAGLGWAIQGRLDSAEANLQVSVNQRRLAGQGKFLPKQVWDYCVDLLDEATQTQLAKYFDTQGFAS